MQIEILKLVSQGGMVSMAVAVILLAMSIGSWTLMVVKSVQVRLLKRNNAAFVAALIPADHCKGLLGNGIADITYGMIYESDSIKSVTSSLLNGHKISALSPYARLTAHGLNSSEQHKQLSRETSGTTRSRDEYIGQSLRRRIGNEAIRLETGLTLLASIGSIAPFVGLFGTVWGIYHALGAIAVRGQATVDKVAGPVGEALIMTAFGLAVAMPAVLAYNALIRDNRLLVAEMENFAHDLYVSLTLGAAQTGKPVIKAPSTKQTMTVVS